jgi:hypothetical protein
MDQQSHLLETEGNNHIGLSSPNRTLTADAMRQQ